MCNYVEGRGGLTASFFCAIIDRPFPVAYVYRLPPLSDEELLFRNLYKAGQRKVADTRRKRKREISLYNDRTFNQLELNLMRVPNQKDWLLDTMRE